MNQRAEENRSESHRGSTRGSRKAPPIGNVFGCWTVVGEAPPSNGHPRWKVRCDCGAEHERQVATLLDGRSTRCGDCQRRAMGQGNRKYPRGTRREYKSYHGMLGRCYDPTNRWFHRYGGRGIRVCDRWRDSFLLFLEDVGRAPSSAHSIDRIDNDRGYEPGNVRWATAKEQARNTRRNRVLTVDGRSQCVAAWAEELGIRPQIISTRLRRGWTDREAVYGRAA